MRALLLDSCNEDDLETGLNIHAILGKFILNFKISEELFIRNFWSLGGLGGAAGYVLAAINWNKTFFKYIGDQSQVVFIFSAVIFFVTLIFTLTSVKEVPFVLEERETALSCKFNQCLMIKFVLKLLSK